MSKLAVKNCAIYTRKSSEEGLEQDFNSLHAQREACEAYIKSQKHEGWQVIKTHYDDGGFSGGNMERPALQQLLQDISEGKIDIVVVYKVDRLTRSLADFAKIIETFDKRNVSFVSVTQQFNTTSSMGRLTLNVLLSFAQFEREVTGERIRDKIAASKKKGMWMGGLAPLGYDVVHKKLVINPQEAETIRYIFTRYLELGCVRILQEEIAEKGIRSKPREKGRKYGKSILSRGTLYNMLSNPLYIGQVRHKGVTYPGQHEAIIDLALWDQVQNVLNNNAVKSGSNRKTEASLLIGKLFDESGELLTPSHANKKGKRYRYYVSKHLTTGMSNNNKVGWRLPAQEIEQAVMRVIKSILADKAAIANALIGAGIEGSQVSSVLEAIGKLESNNHNTLLQRAELHQSEISVTILLPATAQRLVTIIRSVPMQMKRRGHEMRLVIGAEQFATNHDPILIKTIAQAYSWFNQLISGEATSIAAIAKEKNVSEGYIGNILPLAFLAPDIVEIIIAGKQPTDLSADALVKTIKLPVAWEAQRNILGLH
ncbi:MAG TPA: recombinase family protein [Rickettsiales bacterium]|nr:recombinase family protein [Rickettsiales bacterium]